MTVSQLKAILKSRITSEVIASITANFKYYRIQPLAIVYNLEDGTASVYEEITPTISGISKSILKDIVSEARDRKAKQVSFCLSIDASDDHAWIFGDSSDYEPECWSMEVTFDLIDGQLVEAAKPQRDALKNTGM